VVLLRTTQQPSVCKISIYLCMRQALVAVLVGYLTYVAQGARLSQKQLTHLGTVVAASLWHDGLTYASCLFFFVSFW